MAEEQRGRVQARVPSHTAWCQSLQARPPLQPAYVIQDIQANPQDSLWIHHPASEVKALTNGSWVEITHCPIGIGQVHTTRADWKFLPAWFYVAPGLCVCVLHFQQHAISSTQARRRDPVPYLCARSRVWVHVQSKHARSLSLLPSY